MDLNFHTGDIGNSLNCVNKIFILTHLQFIQIHMLLIALKLIFINWLINFFNIILLFQIMLDLLRKLFKYSLLSAIFKYFGFDNLILFYLINFKDE